MYILVVLIVANTSGGTDNHAERSNPASANC